MVAADRVILNDVAREVVLMLGKSRLKDLAGYVRSISVPELYPCFLGLNPHVRRDWRAFSRVEVGDPFALTSF